MPDKAPPPKGKVVQITLPADVFASMAHVAAQQDRDVPGLLRHIAGRIHRQLQKAHDPVAAEVFEEAVQQAPSD